MASLRTPDDHGYSIFNGAMGMDGQPTTATLTNNGLTFNNPRPVPGRFPSVPSLGDSHGPANTNVQYG